jgi:hypothetical protein
MYLYRVRCRWEKLLATKERQWKMMIHTYIHTHTHAYIHTARRS